MKKKWHASATIGLFILGFSSISRSEELDKTGYVNIPQEAQQAKVGSLLSFPNNFILNISGRKGEVLGVLKSPSKTETSCVLTMEAKTDVILSSETAWEIKSVNFGSPHNLGRYQGATRAAFFQLKNSNGRTASLACDIFSENNYFELDPETASALGIEIKAPEKVYEKVENKQPFQFTEKRNFRRT